MRVLHVIPSISQKSGGPAFALPWIVSSLSGQGIDADVAATDDDGPGQRLDPAAGSQSGFPAGCHVRLFRKQAEFYKVSLPLLAWLRQNVSAYSLVHIHALFSFASLAAARVALHHRVPYVIRPLGVLNRWGMENRRRWLKGLSFRSFDRPALNRAAAIHYTSEQEAAEASRLGLRARPAVIPIGPDLQPFDNLPSASLFHESFPETRESFNILFLSRLDPKKGLEPLLRAFVPLHRQFPHVRLVIAGEGDDAYAGSLKALATELGIDPFMTWTGHLRGDMRLAALSSASLFVLPSYSENFGIALLEAMASGIPCVSTEGVALAAEAAPKKAVLLAKPEPAELTHALERLITDASLAASLGATARSLAKAEYSLSVMGANLAKLYQEILGTPAVENHSAINLING